MAVGALFIWAATPRPTILIDETERLFAALGPGRRVLSGEYGLDLLHDLGWKMKVILCISASCINGPGPTFPWIVGA